MEIEIWISDYRQQFKKRQIFLSQVWTNEEQLHYYLHTKLDTGRRMQLYLLVVKQV